MENTIIYTGTYKDANRERGIEVVNDLYDLSFTVDGARFTSIDMEEWTLTNVEECSEEQIDNFSLGTVTTKQGFNLVTEYQLKDCEIFFTIPQQILSKESATELISDLNISIAIEGNMSKVHLALKIGDVNEEIKEIYDFDSAFKKINTSINKKYILFNCYNCRYSSYNVYGQSLFGSLQCYKKYKERFLKIKNKMEYLAVQDQGYETVQEIYYCDEFQLPEKNQFLYK